ncbi:MAG: segregation/condensation protein A [Coriobacteriia bacterium]|nr:segregation/condensation protein A [Coriobacteriia bacterium]
MAYRVAIESFEGPFDLLLSLVSEQKLDIGRVSVADVADQYLSHIDSIRDLDMDVASEFLVVASTLLALKTEALLPESVSTIDQEFEDFTPDEARDLLVSRLIAYKQFKNAAAALNSRLESEGRMHARHAGVESQFVGLLPDYLEGVTLHSLAVICADLAARREVFLLEAEHVVARPLEIESVLMLIMSQLQSSGTMLFSQLLKSEAYPRLVVTGILSLLELYHRGIIDLEQADTWSDIEIVYRDESDWQPAVEPEPEIDPVDMFLEQLAGDPDIASEDSSGANLSDLATLATATSPSPDANLLDPQQNGAA